jgi:hypothetical protein
MPRRPPTSGPLFPGVLGNVLMAPSERALPTALRSLGGGGGGAAAPTYSPAESAIILPQSAIWISQQGVTQAAGTVSAWVSYLGGVSATLAQGLVGSQPAWSASGGVGGRPLITTDGVDDVLFGTVTKGSAFADYEIGMVGNRVAFGAANDLWWGYQITVSPMFYLNDQLATLGRFTVAGGANVSLTGFDPDGLNAHYSGDAASGVINARVNGSIVATTAAAVTSRADGNTAVFGANASGAAMQGNVAAQALYIGPSLLADQRIYLRGALTFWTGINC